MVKDAWLRGKYYDPKNGCVFQVEVCWSEVKQMVKRRGFVIKKVQNVFESMTVVCSLEDAEMLNSRNNTDPFIPKEPMLFLGRMGKDDVPIDEVVRGLVRYDNTKRNALPMIIVPRLPE